MIEKNAKGKLLEKGIIDCTDSKWGHPLAAEVYPPQINAYPVPFYDPDFPLEKKLEARKQMEDQMAKMVSMDPNANNCWTTYTVTDTCPEEPDAPPIRIDVRIPEKKTKKKRPVVMVLCGGALVYCCPNMFKRGNNEISETYNAIVVVPVFRTCIDAPYPAAINDLHTAYKWVVENAEMLGADPDNITLTGSSSGGHLGLSLAFRLKRYGYRPRGCVAVNPITDYRGTKACSRTFVSEGEWNGQEVCDNAACYLGKNFGSPFLGPEAYANLATVEDCKGLCPVFICTNDLDPDVQYSLELVDKLLQAGVYVGYHITSGMSHGIGNFAAIDEGIAKLAQSYIQCGRTLGLEQCINYDLRR